MNMIPNINEFSLFGLWLVFTTILGQSIVAIIAHRSQDKYIPGVLDQKLGHESFVFRSDRTFKNSLENIIPFSGAITLAIISGVNQSVISISIWVFAVARIFHMALYYAIATEKNPSPRSYFYMIGLLTNIVLMGFVLNSLI